MKDWLPIVIATVVALAGTGGIVFGALRYNRDEAGKVVSQQSTILDDMRDLMAERESAYTKVKEERDEAINGWARCRNEVAKLRRALFTGLGAHSNEDDGDE